MLTGSQNQNFRQILTGIPSECQTNWTQNRPDGLSGLIWVQTVCKDYQQIINAMIHCNLRMNMLKGKHNFRRISLISIYIHLCNGLQFMARVYNRTICDSLFFYIAKYLVNMLIDITKYEIGY